MTNIKPNGSLFLVLGMLTAHACQQAIALKVLNSARYPTPSCSDEDGVIIFPFLPSGRCSPVIEAAAYFIDCDAGTVSTYSDKTCSSASQTFDMKCYEGVDDNNAAGFSCSDIDASKLLLVQSGGGCADGGIGVETLMGSQLYTINECTKYGTTKSFKAVVGDDDVVTTTWYDNSDNCEGEPVSDAVSGPIGECFESGGGSYFFTRLEEDEENTPVPTKSPDSPGSAHQTVVSGLLIFMNALIVLFIEF